MKPLTVQENKPLREVCTFGIGGPARYFVEVHTVEQAQEALSLARELDLPFHVLGKGSNTLFHDMGINAVVILNKIDFIAEIIPGRFHVGGGYSFSLLGVQTARQGWSGLEFASGIPATIGGAVFMNAGANGSETAAALESVDFVDADSNLQTIPKADLHFAYRTSSFQRLRGIITGATFQLKKHEQARQQQLEIINYRKHTQPYSDKSAGCVFRNPENLSAGSLIDKAGLKGISIGGAKVSEKHANFIVNSGKASSMEIQELINLIRQRVKDHAGVELESEIRCIPYDLNEPPPHA